MTTITTAKSMIVGDPYIPRYRGEQHDMTSMTSGSRMFAVGVSQGPPPNPTIFPAGKERHDNRPFHITICPDPARAQPVPNS